jgi:hypothetical protein
LSSYRFATRTDLVFKKSKELAHRLFHDYLGVDAPRDSVKFFSALIDEHVCFGLDEMDRQIEQCVYTYVKNKVPTFDKRSLASGMFLTAARSVNQTIATARKFVKLLDELPHGIEIEHELPRKNGSTRWYRGTFNGFLVIVRSGDGKVTWQYEMRPKSHVSAYY